ncbi:MAG: holo-ACP synthase [Puniceicoccales bacterium]|nr:holo-ACP synthase [Puniceicoccales bacterium]
MSRTIKSVSCGTVEISDLSLGTDIVETNRIVRLIERFGESFLRKIFNGDEIAYCLGTSNPASGFAARFATKEAFSKALGTGIGKSVGWKDVSVGKKASGEPYVILSGKAVSSAQSLGFSEAKISLSHTKTLAQAIVVLIRKQHFPG